MIFAPAALTTKDNARSNAAYIIRTKTFTLLKPAGCAMHQQFNIQQLYVLPTLYYVFGIYLRTNSDLCYLQHKLIGFYNPN
jgi:hypothetical protein